MSAPIILVHGGWTGAWAWDWVSTELEALGVQGTAVELHRGSLAADTAAVQGVVDRCDARPVVAGWSYGGSVITGLDSSSVRALVYVAAFVLDVDETPLTLVASEPATMANDVIRVRHDGQLELDPVLARSALCHDCDDTVAEVALSRLTTEPGYGFGESPAATAWRTIPSTVVVCTEDRFLSPNLQREMAHRGSSVEFLRSSHAALWSHPRRLAQLLIEAAYG